MKTSLLTMRKKFLIVNKLVFILSKVVHTLIDIVVVQTQWNLGNEFTLIHQVLDVIFLSVIRRKVVLKISFLNLLIELKLPWSFVVLTFILVSLSLEVLFAFLKVAQVLKQLDLIVSQMNFVTMDFFR